MVCSRSAAADGFAHGTCVTSRPQSLCIHHFCVCPGLVSYHVQVYEEVLSNVTNAAPGGASELFWLYDTPSGLRDMLKWVSERYKRPEVWVTENGFAVKGEAAAPLKEALQDARRIQFFT